MDKQVKYKLNFNVELLDVDGIPVKVFDPKRLGEDNLTAKDLIVLTINKRLGALLANSNWTYEAKELEWYSILYKTGILELDTIDCSKFLEFIKGERKSSNRNNSYITNIEYVQIVEVFKKSGFKLDNNASI
jgi:hypothetical protein